MEKTIKKLTTREKKVAMAIKKAKKRLHEIITTEGSLNDQQDELEFVESELDEILFQMVGLGKI